MNVVFLRTATSAAAIVAGLAIAPAYAAKDDTQGAQTQDAKAQDKIDITTWNYADLYKGWSAEEFLDADVYDEDGQEIGEVADIIVSPDGQLRKLVIEAGGFLDIGDTHFAYPWDKARIVSPDRVEVKFDEDNIDSYSLFGDIEGEPVGPRNWRITELIDDYAVLGKGQRYGWVDDVIISRGGQVEAVVVQPDVTYGVRGPYAWPYYGYAYGWQPGLDYYAVPYTKDEIATLKPFDYDRLDGQDSAEADQNGTAGQASDAAQAGETQ